MIKRIIFLTSLLLAGIMIASLRGQSEDVIQMQEAKRLAAEAAKEESLKVPEIGCFELPHEPGYKKDFIRFYRLVIDGQKGSWHMYNEADDKHYLTDVQRRINSGQYAGGKIEWFAVEGRLPK